MRIFIALNVYIIGEKGFPYLKTIKERTYSIQSKEKMEIMKLKGGLNKITRKRIKTNTLRRLIKFIHL